MEFSFATSLVVASCVIVLSFYTRITSANTRSVYVVVLKEPSVAQMFSMSEFDEKISIPSNSEDDYALKLTRSHEYLLEQAFGKGNYEKLYSYSYLVNGFAVLLSESQVETLKKLPQVVLIEEDTKFEKQTTYTPTYIGLANGAWNEDGGKEHAGEGIVIGLVDSGIDPTHPSFKDDNYASASQYQGTCQYGAHFPQGSCTNKLVGAQYFAKGAIASGHFDATSQFASPYDGDGHGTHTASTAAGNNNVEVMVDGMSFGFASGMAPRAHVAMYRALYPNIGGVLSDVVAAVEQAAKDKVDILSLSVGPSTLPSGPCVFVSSFDIAMLSAAKAGVFVVQAAGNSGPSPLSIASFSPWICSVAASVHDRTYPNSMTLGNNQTIQGTGLATGTSGNAMYGLISANDASKDPTEKNAGSCQDASLLQKELVQSKILICNYSKDLPSGISSINKLVSTVKNLSAAGVVMAFEPQLYGLTSLRAIPFPVPAILVSDRDEVKAIWDYYATAPKASASAKILGGAAAKYSKEIPKVAAYSSRGPNPENNQRAIADILKPNIMAPGSMIWAAWSKLGQDSQEFQGQNFAMISGTSMATPHIAGIAALIKKKNPKLSPAAITSALATTAYCTDENGIALLAQYPSSNTSLPLGPGTPFDFGGGEVNATAALDPGLVFDAGYEDYHRFLCSIPGSAAAVLISTGKPCPLNAGSPTDLNLPSITVASLEKARELPRQVTNIAGTSETYNVQIKQPHGASVEVLPMQFTIAAGKTQDLKVTLTASEKSATPQFGDIKLVGSNGHVLHVPVSIASISV